MKATYKTSGVDIEAGDATVQRIKPLVNSTHNERVLSGLGHFGGFFDAKFPEYDHPVLVASTDGVGTKLKIAFLTGKHNTVGQCLVNHCVNDILACGASPLFFLDYFATGKLDPDVAVSLIEGFSIACRENGAALIGGETAEMPSMYLPGEYDISGTIVGVVEKSKIIDGRNISAGDLMIGLPSTGLHTNGYSLARTVLFEKFVIDTKIDELGMSMGEALLAVHRSYLHVVKPLLDLNLINGISHITGGGIVGNTKRIIPQGLSMDINWQSWNRPALFNIIQREGKIDESEMRHVFNLGIGMILIVSKNKSDEVLSKLEAEKPVVLGKIV